MNKYIEDLVIRYPNLNKISSDIEHAYEILVESFKKDGKLLIAGNGGSSADADHIVGELMKGFVFKRELERDIKEKIIQVDENRGNVLVEKLQQGLPCISLSNHNSLNTAFSNDVDGSLCFAQQVNGYGREGDVLLCITTSGNSENILNATVIAKALNMKVIGLTGRDGGILNDYCDVNMIVPEEETYKIQELHLPIYHCLCLMLESKFFIRN